ncbi:hypothetical protein [Ruegeria sp. HKCCD7296]|uniref:hypothetical protein n=1 Tax=Ruegeria sp. HKCCD7296 TaxID=2683012 RepID=UPI0014929CF1|nr:hypothetical protein [Ruegeria sp. HKCCD7296]NOD33431.1 hypothetical protein [Ruegeria sp. HKCCD7296]
MAFQVDASQVLHANRADQQDGDGECIFARQSPAIRFGHAAWSRENPFRQEQQALLMPILLQHPQPASVLLGHAILRFDRQARGKPGQCIASVIGCIKYPGQVAEQRGDLTDHLCGLVVGAR